LGAPLARRGRRRSDNAAVKRFGLAPLVALLLVLLAQLCVSPRLPPPATDGLPARLSDTAFWKLVTDLSEDGGYFRSDNLISNEDTFQ